jgi:hypothetical protein
LGISSEKPAPRPSAQRAPPFDGAAESLVAGWKCVGRITSHRTSSASDDWLDLFGGILAERGALPREDVHGFGVNAAEYT